MDFLTFRKHAFGQILTLCDWGNVSCAPALAILIGSLCILAADAPSGPTRRWTDYANPSIFEHLSTDRGLSHSTVYCALQNRRGFLWFGTEDGLNRYDGHRFIVFRHEDENPNSLGGDWVTCLLEDAAGSLWVGTLDGGLSRIDQSTLQVQRYRTTDAPGFLNTTAINCLAEDHDGNLWIGCADSGLFMLPRRFKPPASAEFKSFATSQDDPKGLPSSNVLSLMCDHRGAMWVGLSDGGVCRLAKSVGQDEYAIERFLPGRTARGAEAPADVTALLEDDRGFIWVGSNQGLYRFFPDEGRFQRFTHQNGDVGSLGFDRIRQLYRDRVGVIWVGTDGGGLDKMLPTRGVHETPRFEHFRHDPKSPGSLSSYSVECIVEDHSGVLWIGTFLAGLNKLILHEENSTEREKSGLMHFRCSPSDPDSLSGNVIDSILEDHRGHLWIGTDGFGLNRVVPPLDPKKPIRFEHFRAQRGRKGALPDDVITCLYEDSKQRMWMGSFTGGLIRVNCAEGGNPSFVQYRHDPKNPSSISSDFVISIFEDSLHRMWIGCIDGGLNRFDPGTGTFKRYQAFQGRNGTPDLESIYAIAEDRFGTLWLATYDGLDRFNPETGKFKVYRPKGGARDISHLFINTLCIDASQNLWIGTKGGGLNRISITPWDGPDPEFIHFGVKNGLPSKQVQALLLDDHGRLWVSTTRGVCYFDTRAAESSSFVAHKGLLAAEFTSNTAFKCRSGELVFGSSSGFVLFHPDELTSNLHVPPLVVTDFRLFNESVPILGSVHGRILLQRSITDTPEIVLSRRDAVVSLDFAALHFVAPEKNEYAYMMEGLDKSWNYIRNQHSITFTTLPPGRYVLRIKGCNSDGLWNEEGIRLKIRVLPPWWKTWWFIASALLLLTGTVVGLVRWRIQRLEILNAELEARVAQRTEALESANLKLQELDKLKENLAAMLVHDLRSPLMVISMGMELSELKGSLDPGFFGQCRHSIHNMINMLNDLLAVFRRQDTEMLLDLKSLRPIDVVRNIQTVFQAQCTLKNVNLVVQVSEELPCFQGDELKIERVLSNLMGNALKFIPEGGTITILGEELLATGVEKGLRWLTLRVEDTGQGISPEELPYVFDPYRQASKKGSHLGVGLGLAVVQRIMAAHKGRVNVRSQLGVGTVFCLFFPLPSEPRSESLP